VEERALRATAFPAKHPTFFPYQGDAGANFEPIIFAYSNINASFIQDRQTAPAGSVSTEKLKV
jgi:hypothetical protein